MAGTLSQCLIVDTDILIDLARREPQALDYLNEQQNDCSHSHCLRNSNGDKKPKGLSIHQGSALEALPTILAFAK